MPWPARPSEYLRRICCGATLPTECLMAGSAPFPHQPPCPTRSGCYVDNEET